ncbi:ABC transporter ATP-binding protein [Marinivivus vitaminiproducens]|uniref:ABC transporter ATP-binding protein n=1 Tax=Marinivivus vitaminiproducens TaxID=3035935 RepID=UPI0027A15006|nr:ABC transporter ATP-binding protein [Geminicoccaceae bacterium SCSIO 64248]
MRGIDKRFGAVHANKRVSFAIPGGTIHGIIGENGAGKSTAMNILYGFYQADGGMVLIDGKEVRIGNSAEAIAAGVGMVHQHFMLVEPFTVLENILLGAEGGMTLKAGETKARAELAALERDYNLEIDLDARVADLPVGLQQRVEILKALYRGARILILDEPTGVLTPQEADHLFRILRNLKAQGRTVVLITHKLREIMAVTDNVTVMRRGEVAANVRTADTSREQLAELMVGRTVLLKVEKTRAQPGEPVLEIDRLTVRDRSGVERVKNVTFSVRRGEIVGIAGVAGNGQSELLEAVAGIRPVTSGTVRVAGREIQDSEGRAEGLGHVPEDRLRLGLIKGFAAYENAVLGYHDRKAYVRGRFMRRASIIRTCLGWMKGYDVRPSDPALRASAFSGGNQQKLVLAREMEHDPDVLLVGQPTRGVDIGAIEFIHKRLIAMRDAGKAILLISVELDEIMALSDRIVVMCDGHCTGEVDIEEAEEQSVGLMMAGVPQEKAA